MGIQEVILLVSPFARIFIASLFVFTLSLIVLKVTSDKEEEKTIIDDHGWKCHPWKFAMTQMFALLGFIFGGMGVLMCSGIYLLSFIFPEYR